ncbi:permease prefix domain 1-containing protein [Planotetraspora sp. GP83]|uniref:permease prefix domain 1-containing protein n=1 Tax=Planotetraspora sp. GP83 TaxID=3156264 RepID=UPI003512A475
MANAGAIDDYVARLRRAVSGPLRAKRDLLAEARDSLLDAAEAYESSGCGRAEAERLAVEDFGPVAEIAPGYQEALAVSQGRRTAALLFLSVPLTALMWSVIWKIFPEPPSALTTPKPGWFEPLARVVDYSQLAIGVLGGAALVALGRGLRRIRRPRLVTRALGLFVWLQMPILLMMCVALMRGAHGPAGFSAYAPGAAVTAISFAFWACQLFSAARCLTATGLTSTGLTLTGRERSRSRS